MTIFLPPWEGAALRPHGSGFLHQVAQDPQGRTTVHKEPIFHFVKLSSWVQPKHTGFRFNLVAVSEKGQ